MYRKEKRTEDRAGQSKERKERKRGRKRVQEETAPQTENTIHLK